MTGAELRRRRAAAQLLAATDGTPHGAVTHLLAVQAQDPRAMRLALRARGAASRAAGVEAAFADRSLVVTWLFRGTLHLVAREDYAWLHACCGAQTAATTRRRLGGLGVDADATERAVAAIERALARDGPLARAELAERMRAAGVPAEGQAVPHLLAVAAARGIVVLAGDAFVLASDWLGPVAAGPSGDAALAELARRYLRGHGPATAADLAAWSGVGLRAARTGLAAIADGLDVDGDLADLAGRPPAPPSPARLLPAFDPYLLGWKDRSFAVPGPLARQVHPGGGIVRATAVMDGRAVATWGLRGGRVSLDPAAEGFADEVAAVERF